MNKKMIKFLSQKGGIGDKRGNKFGDSLTFKVPFKKAPAGWLHRLHSV